MPAPILKKLHIINYTDLHGAFISNDYFDSAHRKVGIDRLLTYLKPIKESGDPVLLIDNGDLIQGNYVVDLFDYNDPRFYGLKHPANIIHEELETDCLIVGNHEFNFGIKQIDAIRNESGTPWLSANILDKNTGLHHFKPYQFFEYGDFKVAVLALTTEYVPLWEDRSSIEGLIFENVYDTAKKYIAKLKQQSDFLIVSYHGGLEKDPITEEKMKFSDEIENQGYRLWNEFEEIDLLILGHQHRTCLHKPEDSNKSIIIQASCKGRVWSHTIIDYIKKEPPIIESCILVEAKDFKPEGSLRKKIDLYYHKCEEILDEPIGTAAENFKISDPLKEVWLKKHPLIQWIQNIMCQRANVDISAISMLSAHLPGLPEYVMVRDVLDNYFFKNTICVINISGEILKKALETCASFFCYRKIDKNDRIIDIHQDWNIVKIRSYDYDMWHGIDYTFNINNPIGSRLTRVEYRGKKVKDKDNFRVATTSYRAAGAFYDMFGVHQIETDFPEAIADLMIKDLKKRRNLIVEPIQNFKIV